MIELRKCNRCGAVGDAHQAMRYEADSVGVVDMRTPLTFDLCRGCVALFAEWLRGSPS